MFTVASGKPDKLGVTLTNKGANFCVYAPTAKSVELLFLVIKMMPSLAIDSHCPKCIIEQPIIGTFL